MEQHKSQYPSAFYRVSLKAVIRNDKGEVLLNKEGDSTNWSLPGGGWDHGETEYAALARELKEEINYDGEFSAKPFATETFWLESKRSYLLWIVYEVVTENMDFGIGEHSTEVAFVDPSSLDENSESLSEQWIRKHLDKS